MSMTLDARGHSPRRAARRAPATGLKPLLWLKRRFRARPGATLAHGAFAVVGLAIVINAALWQPAPDRAGAPDQQAASRAAPPMPPQRPTDLAAAPVAATNPVPTARVATQPPQTSAPSTAARPPAATREQPREAAREGGRDQIGDLIRTGMVPGMEAPRPPAAVVERVAATSGGERPVLAAQRALNKLGMGNLRADGRFGEETRAALERFERERRIPVTRDLSPRTLRELAAASGIRME
jgi:type IV secretory pathway VirB10-like protein